MSTSTLGKAVNVALSQGTPKNFVTGAEAKTIVAAAEQGGVSKAERAQLQKLMGGWTYNDDNAFGRTEAFDRPTLSMDAGIEIQKLLGKTDTSALDAAVSKALGNGTPKNFITGAEAKEIVAAAREDGSVNDAERAELDSLRMGWTYYDDKAFGRTEAFEKPTLSMNAGIAVNELFQQLDK